MSYYLCDCEMSHYFWITISACIQSQGFLLWYFYFYMDIMVSEAIATNTSDTLPSQTDPLVRLDACGDL